MVALVIVAHSQTVAEGVCRMADQMAQARVAMVAAGGVSDGETLGTDANRIVEAIRALAARPGCEAILILVDLGSAILSAETALDLLAGEGLPPTRVSQAPLVEGAVAAAVAAAAGRSLAEVEAEACAAGLAKIGTPALRVEPSPAPEESTSDLRIQASLGHAHGLHARPAAAFVACAAAHRVQVRVRDLTTGSAWVNGTSLTQLVTLGSRQGDRLEIAVSGAEAAQAASALRSVVAEAPAPRDPLAAPASPERAPDESVYSGIPVSAGIAVGPARRLAASLPAVERRFAEDARHELERMQQARRAARADLERLIRRARQAGQLTQADLLLAHSLLLDDPTLVHPAEERILRDNWSAEAAWEEAVSAAALAFEAQPDEYVRAREADVRDAGNRVLRLLLRGSEPVPALAEPGILIADDLSPSQIVELDPRNVLGICTVAGSPTSHASILARALLIPAVVGCGARVLEVPEGAQVVLDGDQGTLTIEATGGVGVRAGARREATQAPLAHLAEAQFPAITRDGRRIEVAANIGSLVEAQALRTSGAEGVGVLRTEFLFLGRQQPPVEEEQVEVYREILRACEGKPMIARTLDVGGDKRLPYLEVIEEENPFLGMRGLRLSLHQPDLFSCQLRALLRAGVGSGLQVMFPMVTTVAELRQARQLLEEARDDLRRRGLPHAEQLPLGMMVEVPAAALMADSFAGETDFMSIGTNDLAQYTQAAERTNPRMLTLGDAASPAVLRLIAQVVQACRAAGIWAGVCGEAAADPVLLPILVGLGVSELSMTPAAIPRSKAQIRGLVWEEAHRLAERALGASSAAEVRSLAGQPARSERT